MMNATARIEPAGQMVDFDAACARLNEWRGQMVENFARAEQAATETLVRLNETAPPVKGVKFPHLVGQRYDRLRLLLAASAAPTAHERIAEAALADFRSHDGLRTMLCHGVTKVAVDRGGGWVALMTLTSFKGGSSTTERLPLIEAEGAAQLAQLIERRRKLTTALGQVRRQYKPAA